VTLDRVTITNGGGVAVNGVRHIGNGSIVLDHVQIVGTQDGCNPCAGMSMHDSYIQLAPTNADEHNDGVQTSGGTINLTHNTIINPNGQTSTVALFTETGSMVNSTISDNFLNMGRQLSVYTGCSTDGHPPTNVNWSNNTFQRNDPSWTDPTERRCVGVTFTGNKWHDGTPIA
jgi:hypothetical protein